MFAILDSLEMDWIVQEVKYTEFNPNPLLEFATYNVEQGY